MPGWLSLERALALAGLAGLLLVAVACLALLAGDDGDGARTAAEGQVAGAIATPTATPTRTPTPTPTPAPTPEPLTPAERAQRSAAVEQVRAQGFEPVSRRAYHPDQDLRVMLGEPTVQTRAAGVPEGRRAFFFVGGEYIGTDTSDVSSDLRIARQTKSTVTLAYGLGTEEEETVRFKWDGSSLTPQSPIPPAEQRRR